MASASPVKFMEAALFATGPFSLSYTDPDQKWLIRDHIISFLQDFPKFKLSKGTFTHNNGTTVNLLCLHGILNLKNSSFELPSIPLTIWLHESYPFMPPLVYVKPETPILTNHPFVDTSGLANPPYIKTWEHPRSNLLELTRKLKKIFAHHHPLACSSSTGSTWTTPSLMSRAEALDRLTVNTHYDILALRAAAEEEIEQLWKLQGQVIARSERINGIIRELEGEKKALKERVRFVEQDADVLVNWVRVNDPTPVEARDVGVEDMFEGVDDESKVVVDSLAVDRAIEDVMMVLDKTMEGEVVSLGLYLRQVRGLAREQFFHRAKHLKWSKLL